MVYAKRENIAIPYTPVIMALIMWLQMLLPATNNSLARNSVLSDKFIITNAKDTPHFENKTESFLHLFHNIILMSISPTFLHKSLSAFTQTNICGFRNTELQPKLWNWI